MASPAGPGRALRPVLAVLALLVLGAVSSGATRSLQGASNHRYTLNETVPLFANKIGPFANPTETYHYFDLPFCHPPDGKEYQWEGLGEVLEGDRLVSTPYDLRFGVDIPPTTLCKRSLSGIEVAAFRAAVGSDYYYQFFYDDLPLWGFVGKVEEDDAAAAEGRSEKHTYLFTHTHFDIQRSTEGQVIQVDVSTDAGSALDISAKGDGAADEPREVAFTYSASWRLTETPFERRLDKYARYSFLPQHLEIHWFSIVNSCVTVLLLTGFLAIILLRVLRRDLLRYSSRRDAEAGGGKGAASSVLDDGEEDECGWKNVHGDVFRAPPAPGAFAAAVGTGAHVLAIAVSVLGLALLGRYHPYSRGALQASCVVLYALTAGVAGYVSASIFMRATGRRDWVRCVLLGAALLSAPLLAVFMVLNSVAWAYGSTAALPAGTIVILGAIWAFGAVPLALAGGALAGRSVRAGGGGWEAPCRTSKLPRPVPETPWFRGALPQMLVAGFLPFSAIYIELYYLFASVWGHKVYTIYPILFIVFCILCVVTAFISVALTYFQLAVEDHRWWWRSFTTGGSTAVFIAAYTLYYFAARSDMSGALQTVYYFGYMGLIAWAFFLMLGALGWAAAGVFVRHIYRAVKLE